ncbi:unnamed protein product, partial [Tetraodon nigroviridis]
DNFDSVNELHWDPHKEFMQFLWDNHDDSPGEESQEPDPPSSNQRRRKRKMDMVVMVDPSEDLYPDLSHKPPGKLADAEGQVNSKVRKVKKFSKSQSPQMVKVSKYPNGTVKAIKEILYNTPARNAVENSIGHRLSMNSHSKNKHSCYPCSKCKLVFKKEHHLKRHMKSHIDLSSVPPQPFVCQECGQSFRQSSLLIEHVSIHQEKRERLGDEVKNSKKREVKTKRLFCPQCPFDTTCPNTFVQHAKTHEKDKKNFKCDKCSFRTLNENDLRRHTIMQHTVISVKKQMEDSDSGMYSCNVCSYRAISKTVFKNHLFRRHQQSFQEHQAAEKNAQPLNCTVSCKSPLEDAEFTSKISIKNQISSRKGNSHNDSHEISDLFKNSKIKRNLKSQLMESKLDKSINALLSRQKHRKKTAEQSRERNHCSIDGSRGDRGSPEHLQGMMMTKEDPLAIAPNGTSGMNNSVTKLNEDHCVLKKSPSKRKMSTPYRNTSEQDSCFILSKPLPSPKKMNQEDDFENDSSSFNDTDASDNLSGSDIRKEKHNLYSYSRRMSMRGALQASKKLFEKIKMEEKEHNEIEIKEECIETEVFQQSFESYQIPLTDSFPEDVLDLESERKNCPYCPAVFESGVGLSNHVRGHLHRAGIDYNARHVVSPEQVASNDKRPRRRKISTFRRLKKALQADLDSETVTSIHSCPLCGDSFDNRTGQSNHIRGHLKKIGKGYASKNKSPLLYLRELMRDKKELQRALHILGKRRNRFHYDVSPKFPSAHCLTPLSLESEKNSSVPQICTEARPLMPVFSLADVDSEKDPQETRLDIKNSLSGTTALIGILKKRKCPEDMRLKASSQISKNIVVPLNAEYSSGARVASSLPKPTSAFDCKAVRPRSRPGSKKKTLPLPQTPEEMYRLTCRFCDLVFQGPLSVQEDWIKHLQRHIMNTSVPHTGLGMIEVAS